MIIRTLVFCMVTLFLISGCTNSEIKVEIVTTTDVHGTFFSYPNEQGIDENGNLSKVYYLVDSLKKQKKNTLIFDNGDMLQGTTDAFYFNYVDTTKHHTAVQITQFIGFNAGTVGNHDLECGPGIYLRLQKQYKHPWLAANIVYENTKKPAFEPYTIIEQSGCKIAVLGLITPGVPKWLPENLWPGLEFEDMVESSRKWINIIKNKENPDFVIGLFHSGWNPEYGGGDSLAPFNENATMLVARQVPGFDLIFFGHDHQIKVFEEKNIENKKVVAVDCGSHSRFVGRATLIVKNNSIWLDKAWVENIQNLPASEQFDSVFRNNKQAVVDWRNTPICTINESIINFEALFAPSTYLNLLHKAQLTATNADLSFASPLNIYNATSSDTLRQTDMFKLYPFENKLYTINLKGSEIIKVLEYSAKLWFNNQFPKSTLLNYAEGEEYKKTQNQPYNFTSAGGIDYIVDFRKKHKNIITISKLHNGKQFSENSYYSVAVNSYQASGGGGHLTVGAGLTKQEIEKRILVKSNKEVREYLTQYLKEKINYRTDNSENWSVEPIKEWKSIIKSEKTQMAKQLNINLNK